MYRKPLNLRGGKYSLQFSVGGLGAVEGIDQCCAARATTRPHRPAGPDTDIVTSAQQAASHRFQL